MDLPGSRLNGDCRVLGRYQYPSAYDPALRSPAPLVDTALARLAGQGAILHYTHQNIAELWNAMTRPLNRNGFGFTVADAEREVQAIEAGMVLLREGEPVYREWRRIVVQHGVLGGREHDGRLCAPMHVYR